MPLPATLGRLFAVSALVCISNLPTFADTVFSTYPTTGTGNQRYLISSASGYTGEHEIAMQFSLPATSQIGSATLALYYDTTITSPGLPFAGGPIDVKIYDDASGSPDTVLTTGTLATILTDGSVDDYTVTFSSPVTLIGGTDYWLSAVGDSSNSATAFWASGTGFGSIADRYDASFNTGFSHDSETLGAFSLQTPAATTPEPGALAVALSLSMVGGGIWRRRRSTKPCSTN